MSNNLTGRIETCVENDDDEAVQRLIDEGKAERYDSGDFKEGFRDLLQHDHSNRGGDYRLARTL